jgi:putative hemolysin
VDGAILCDLAARTRGEFRILIHAMLCRDADLARCFLPVDFEPTAEATRNNLHTRRIALATLREQGTLLIYPGGGVATASRLGFGNLRDMPWTTFAAKLVQQSGATVVPAFFHGANSRLFHVLSHVHPALRTGLLLREARRQFGTTVRMEIGAPIPYERVHHIRCRARLTELLHRETWRLGHAGELKAT